MLLLLPSLLLLLPSLLHAAPRSPLAFSYSVEQPSAGLSFGQEQGVEGGDLVGSYWAQLPGRQARHLRHQPARQTRYQGAGAGHGTTAYHVAYRL